MIGKTWKNNCVELSMFGHLFSKNKQTRLQENLEIQKTLLKISLQPIVEVGEEKNLSGKKMQKVSPFRTGFKMLQEASKCFKIETFMFKGQGLLKLFPSTNPVMNSMSSSSVVPPEKYLNLMRNPTRAIVNDPAGFFGFCFQVMLATGHKNPTQMNACSHCKLAKCLSQRCPQLFRGMNSKCSPFSHPC